MNCKKVRETLLDWDNLTSLSNELNEHLKICPECRQEYGIIRDTAAVLADLPEIKPSREFSSAWKKRICEETSKSSITANPVIQSDKFKPFLRRFLVLGGFRPVFAGLAAVVILAVGLMVYVNVSNQASPGKSSNVIAASGSYQIKIIQMGSRSKEVQKVIRNFRSANEGGIVFTHREGNEDWGVFKKLNSTHARNLLRDLENAGAVVKVNRE